jgi:molecular chaperone HtpG
LEEDAKTLTEIFKKALNKEELELKLEKLKDNSIASMVTLSEESRRMQDMMKMYGMAGLDASAFGSKLTLVLNANHELVKYVLAHQDSDNVGMICEQLYDLAVISHEQLNPEAMTKFIQRSNEIMQMVIKE